MRGKSQPLGMLGSVPLFEGLSQRELRAVHAAAKEIDFPPGHVVVAEGREGIGFHLILDGTAKVTVKGRKRATLGPGDYFGEMSLLDGQPRSATVTAETELRTLALPSWNFRQAVKNNPSIAIKLLEGMTRRLRDVQSSSTD